MQWFGSTPYWTTHSLFQSLRKLGTFGFQIILLPTIIGWRTCTKHFFARMNTTQRSEWMNNLVKMCVQLHYSLLEFFSKFDNVVSYQCEKRNKLNHHDLYAPQTITPLGIEKSLLSVYTNGSFMDFQHQAALSMHHVMNHNTNPSSQVSSPFQNFIILFIQMLKSMPIHFFVACSLFCEEDCFMIIFFISFTACWGIIDQQFQKGSHCPSRQHYGIHKVLLQDVLFLWYLVLSHDLYPHHKKHTGDSCVTHYGPMENYTS